jgi:hypothetical protein
LKYFHALELKINEIIKNIKMAKKTTLVKQKATKGKRKVKSEEELRKEQEELERIRIEKEKEKKKMEKKLKAIEKEVVETYNRLRSLASNEIELNRIEHIFLNNLQCEMVITRDNYRDYDGSILIGTSRECEKFSKEYVDSWMTSCDDCPMNPKLYPCKNCTTKEKCNNNM